MIKKRKNIFTFTRPPEFIETTIIINNLHFIWRHFNWSDQFCEFFLEKFLRWMHHACDRLRLNNLYRSLKIFDTLIFTVYYLCVQTGFHTCQLTFYYCLFSNKKCSINIVYSRISATFLFFHVYSRIAATFLFCIPVIFSLKLTTALKSTMCIYLYIYHIYLYSVFIST